MRIKRIGIYCEMWRKNYPQKWVYIRDVAARLTRRAQVLNIIYED